MRAVADRKSTRLNSSHTVIYSLSLHDALPIYIVVALSPGPQPLPVPARHGNALRFSADSPMRGQQTVVCGKCPQNPTELAGQSPSGGFDGILSVACAPSQIGRAHV